MVNDAIYWSRDLEPIRSRESDAYLYWPRPPSRVLALCARGVVEWHEAKPSALSSTRPQPEWQSHVKHDTTTLSGLKYLPLMLDLDSLNFQVPCDRRIRLSPSVIARTRPCSSVPQLVFFWQPEKLRLVVRADLKQWSDEVLRLRASWP